MVQTRVIIFSLLGLARALQFDAQSRFKLSYSQNKSAQPTLRPRGTECDESEILTYDQCLEAMQSGIGGNTMGFGDVPHLQANPGISGCFYYAGNKNVYYNPKATAGGIGLFEAICAPNGGRTQEKIDFPVDPMPEVQKLPIGVRCEEGCGILTLDQCIKVGVDKLVPNQNIQGIPIVQLNPGARGCYRSSGNAHIYYNPDDGYAENASRWGKGSVASVAEHICGVCKMVWKTTGVNGYCVDGQGRFFDGYKKDGHTLDGCQALCTSIPQCVSLTYISRKQRCVIHTANEVPSREPEGGWDKENDHQPGEGKSLWPESSGVMKTAQCYIYVKA